MRDRHAHEIGIGEIARAIVKCAAQRFDDQMIGRGLADAPEREALEHAERLRERDAAGGRQRSGRDGRAAIGEAHRLALDHLVAREIHRAPDPPGLVHRFEHRLRDGAFVKACRAEARDALERARERGLPQEKSGLGCAAAVEKDVRC